MNKIVLILFVWIGGIPILLFGQMVLNDISRCDTIEGEMWINECYNSREYWKGVHITTHLLVALGASLYIALSSRFVMVNG